MLLLIILMRAKDMMFRCFVDADVLRALLMSFYAGADVIDFDFFFFYA